MSSPKPVVLLVAPSGLDAADVTGPLKSAGFGVQQTSGTRSASDGVSNPVARAPGSKEEPPAVVLVVVESAPELAVAFTRRLRADTVASPLPILWLLNADTLPAAAAGLDAGADACLVRPTDGDLLTAQVNALLRTHGHLTRLSSKGADAHDLTERLQKLFRQTEADAALARLTTVPPRPTGSITSGDVSAGWFHRPAHRGGVGLFDVTADATGPVRLFLTDAGGLGPCGGVAVAGAVERLLLRDTANSPAAALTAASRWLLDLHLPDTAVVSAAVGVIHPTTGEVAVACAGLPAPVLVPADGPASVWHGSGPFLGTTAAGYFDTRGELKPGERLILIAGGAAADRRPDVRALAEQHRGLAVQPFAEAVAKELLADAHPDDGFTLLAMGREPNPSGTMTRAVEETP